MNRIAFRANQKKRIGEWKWDTELIEAIKWSVLDWLVG
jgi:hypothetical protein